MREQLRDHSRLLHILQAIDNIMRFTEGKELEEFTDDSILFFAVVKIIEIIGEAAYKLTSEFKDSHPMTPWKQIIGMRHVLVHGYCQVSASEVWGVTKKRLAPLRSQIEAYVSETHKSEEEGE